MRIAPLCLTAARYRSPGAAVGHRGAVRIRDGGAATRPRDTATIQYVNVDKALLLVSRRHRFLALTKITRGGGRATNYVSELVGQRATSALYALNPKP